MAHGRVTPKAYLLTAIGVAGLSALGGACSAGGHGNGLGEGGAGCGLPGAGGASNNPTLTEILTVDTTGFDEIKQDFYFAPKFAGTGCQGTPGIWAEAMQESLWWFNINKSGPGITHTAVQWRGDSHLEDGHIKLDPTVVNMSQTFIDKYKAVLDPDGNGEVDMAGGYYDAGDFLKIGITTNFMAHTLGWVMWDFPEAFAATGLRDEMLRTLRWSADYMMKNTYVTNPTEADPWKWEVIAYGHQVGSTADHDCGWMPPELRRVSFCPRKAFFATSEAPASDVTAGAAAALALTGWHYRLVDPEYATKCLNHAIALYEFSKQYAGTKWSVDGLYVSEDAYSHLSWAALWLNQVLPNANQAGATAETALYASHKQDYLDDLVVPGRSWIEKIRGQGPQISCMLVSDNCWTESWTHVWNSLRSGLFVKLASVLAGYGNAYAKLQAGMQGVARADSLAWVTGPKTAGGFSEKVNVSWGSGRYNSGGQLVALAYAKAFPDDVVPADQGGDAGLAGQKVADLLIPWAKSQSEYLLGKNPIHESYLMGMNGLGDHFAPSAHHAATHASIYGLCGKPVESRHIAYGALVSGPNDGDNHSGDRCDYGSNEITIDYNAAFFGAFAANYAFQGTGQCPDPAFPPSEPPTDEFYTESSINNAATCRSQVTIALVNETAYPPRYTKDLTVRYYINAAELQAKGIDPLTAVTGKVIYDGWPEFPTSIGPLKACKLDTSTFYFEMAHPHEFWGRQSLLHGPRTVLLDVGVADGPSCTWDPSNDWGYSALKTGDPLKSKNVPAYLAGQLVWGAEPKCDEPPKVIVPPEVPK